MKALDNSLERFHKLLNAPFIHLQKIVTLPIESIQKKTLPKFKLVI